MAQRNTATDAPPAPPGVLASSPPEPRPEPQPLQPQPDRQPPEPQQPEPQPAEALAALTTQAAAAAAAQAGWWTVYDTNAARDPKKIRSHEIEVDGEKVIVELRAPPGKGTKLPPPMAMKFLIDEAFHVIDENGQRVRPLPKAEIDPANGGVILKPGQTVAYFDEMTEGALRTRVAKLPGIQVTMVANATRNELVNALVQQDKREHDLRTRKPAEAEPVGWRDRAEDPVPGLPGMAQAELDRLIGKAA